MNKSNNKKYKFRFNIWIRVISFILIVAFIWQDIIWANPEFPHLKTSTLATQTLATGENKEDSFKRWASLMLHNHIARLMQHGQVPFIADIEAKIQSIKETAYLLGIKGPEIKGNVDIGAIKIAFRDGDELLFYDPHISNAAKIDLTNDPWDHMSSDKKKIQSDTEINKYLREQVISQKETKPSTAKAGDRELPKAGEIKVKSTKGELNRIDLTIGPIVDAAKQSGLNVTLPQDIYLGIYEITKNAFEHGNNFNPDKDVTIRWNISDEKLVAEIIDEGEDEEFDEGSFYNTIRINPRGPAAKRGRGIHYVVLQYADDVTFENITDETGNKKGTKIILTWHKDRNLGKTKLKEKRREILTGRKTVSTKPGQISGENKRKLIPLAILLIIGFFAKPALAGIKNVLEDAGVTPEFIPVIILITAIAMIGVFLALTIVFIWHMVKGFKSTRGLKEIPGLITNGDNEHKPKDKARYPLYRYIPIEERNLEQINDFKNSAYLKKKIEYALKYGAKDRLFFLLYYPDAKKLKNIGIGLVELKIVDGIMHVKITQEDAYPSRRLSEIFIIDEILKRNPRSIVFEKDCINENRMAFLLPDHERASKSPHGMQLTEEASEKLEVDVSDPRYAHYALSELSFAERRTLYFSALRFNKTFRAGDIFWWFQHFFNQLIVGMAYPSILGYADQKGILSTYNFTVHILTVILIPAITYFVAKFVAKLVRHRRDVRSGESGFAWQRKVQNQRTMNKILRLFLVLAFIRILFRMAYFILIPQSAFSGAFGSNLLFDIASPTWYLGFFLFHWLFTTTCGQFLQTHWTETVRGSLLTSEKAVKKGYARQYDVTVNFGSIFGKIITAAALSLGFGIATLSFAFPVFKNIIIPLVLVSSIISVISGFILPVWGREYKTHLRIDGPDYVEIPGSGNRFKLSKNVEIKIKPLERELKKVELIKLKNGSYWLPWIDDALKMKLTYYGVKPSIEQKMGYVIIKGSEKDAVIRARRVMGRVTLKDFKITPIKEDAKIVAYEVELINSQSENQASGMGENTEGIATNFTFGEGVAFRHVKADAIIRLYKKRSIWKGPHYHTRVYEKTMEKSRNIHKVEQAIKELGVLGGIYAERARKLREDTTIIEIDIPTHLIAGGRDNKGAVYYQLTHLGRTRKIIYIPKKVLESLDMRKKKDRQKLATVLNHDQQELDILHVPENQDLAQTAEGTEIILRKAHKKASQDDPFGVMDDLNLLIKTWLQKDKTMAEATKTEVKKLELRYEKLKEKFTEAASENRPEDFYDTAEMVMQLANAYEVLEDHETALQYCGEAVYYFTEVEWTDLGGIRPTDTQVQIISLFAKEGEYRMAKDEFVDLLRGYIGRPLTELEIPVFRTYMSNNIEIILQQIAYLFVRHAQSASTAEEKTAREKRIFAIIEQMTILKQNFLENLEGTDDVLQTNLKLLAEALERKEKDPRIVERSYIERVHYRVFSENQPVFAVFDVYGTLLEPTWKKEWAMIYEKLMKKGQPPFWVTKHVMGKKDEEIIAHLQDISGKTKRRIRKIRRQVRQKIIPRPMPGAFRFIKELVSRGVPIAVISGSERELVVRQLKKAGFLSYIPEENIICGNKRPRLNKKETIINFQEEHYPNHAIAYFDDQPEGVAEIKRLGGICFGVPQGGTGEFEINRDSLAEKGVNYILHRWGAYKIIVDEILRIPDPSTKVPEELKEGFAWDIFNEITKDGNTNRILTRADIMMLSPHDAVLTEFALKLLVELNLLGKREENGEQVYYVPDYVKRYREGVRDVIQGPLSKIKIDPKKRLKPQLYSNKNADLFIYLEHEEQMYKYEIQEERYAEEKIKIITDQSKSYKERHEALRGLVVGFDITSGEEEAYKRLIANPFEREELAEIGMNCLWDWLTQAKMRLIRETDLRKPENRKLLKEIESYIKKSDRKLGAILDRIGVGALLVAALPFLLGMGPASPALQIIFAILWVASIMLVVLFSRITPFTVKTNQKFTGRNLQELSLIEGRIKDRAKAAKNIEELREVAEDFLALAEARKAVNSKEIGARKDTAWAYSQAGKYFMTVAKMSNSSDDYLKTSYCKRRSAQIYEEIYLEDKDSMSYPSDVAYDYGKAAQALSRVAMQKGDARLMYSAIELELNSARFFRNLGPEWYGMAALSYRFVRNNCLRIIDKNKYDLKGNSARKGLTEVAADNSLLAAMMFEDSGSPKEAKEAYEEAGRLYRRIGMAKAAQSCFESSKAIVIEETGKSFNPNREANLPPLSVIERENKILVLKNSEEGTMGVGDVERLIRFVETIHNSSRETKELLLNRIFRNAEPDPETEKLKSIFRYMLTLAKGNVKFREKLLEALRSPPIGMDKTTAISSSNLDISSVSFVISDNLPIDSARYFNPRTNQAIIVFNKDFFNLDNHIPEDDAESREAALYVRVERLMHELRHDNNMSLDVKREIEEDAWIIAYFDTVLWEYVTSLREEGKRSMQDKIDIMLENYPKVNASMHHSGALFARMEGWARERNLVSRQVSVERYIRPNMPVLQQGKTFPILFADLSEDPYRQIEYKEALEVIDRLSRQGSLSTQERRVLDLSFGLEDGICRTPTEIARMRCIPDRHGIGIVTTSWGISWIRNNALKKVREYFENEPRRTRNNLAYREWLDEADRQLTPQKVKKVTSLIISVVTQYLTEELTSEELISILTWRLAVPIGSLEAFLRREEIELAKLKKSTERTVILKTFSEHEERGLRERRIAAARELGFVSIEAFIRKIRELGLAGELSSIVVRERKARKKRELLEKPQKKIKKQPRQRRVRETRPQPNKRDITYAARAVVAENTGRPVSDRDFLTEVAKKLFRSQEELMIILSRKKINLIKLRKRLEGWQFLDVWQRLRKRYRLSHRSTIRSAAKTELGIETDEAFYRRAEELGVLEGLQEIEKFYAKNPQNIIPYELEKVVKSVFSSPNIITLGFIGYIATIVVGFTTGNLHSLIGFGALFLLLAVSQKIFNSALVRIRDAVGNGVNPFETVKGKKIIFNYPSKTTPFTKTFTYSHAIWHVLFPKHSEKLAYGMQLSLPFIVLGLAQIVTGIVFGIPLIESGAITLLGIPFILIGIKKIKFEPIETKGKEKKVPGDMFCEELETKEGKAYLIKTPFYAKSKFNLPEKVLLSSCGTYIDELNEEDVDIFAERIANIAIESAKVYERKTKNQAIVSFISYETIKFESELSKNKYILLMQKAAKIAREKALSEGIDIKIIGEGGLQLDAALMPDVFKTKTKARLLPAVPGEFPPNVYIFPHLPSLEVAKGLIIFAQGHPVAQSEPNLAEEYKKELEAKARTKDVRIVIPEATNEDVLIAVQRLVKNRITRVVLLGKREDIEEVCDKNENIDKEIILNSEHISIVDPETHMDEAWKQDLIETFCVKQFGEKTEENLKKARRWLKFGLSLLCKVEGIEDPNTIWFAAGMVVKGEADSMVAGKVYPSAAVYLTAKLLTTSSSEAAAISGNYLMHTKFKDIGFNGKLVLSDMASRECPDAKELTDIIMATAEHVRSYINADKIRLAFVSDKSTESGKAQAAIEKATEKLKDIYGDRASLDGPISIEEALTGNYSGIIVSDLCVGNIAYKALQRICNFEGLAILTGNCAESMLDISRGADREEIYTTMLAACCGVKDAPTKSQKIEENVRHIIPRLVRYLAAWAHNKRGEQIVLALGNEVSSSSEIRRLINEYLLEALREIHANNEDIELILKNLYIISGTSENLAGRINHMVRTGKIKRENVIIVTDTSSLENGENRNLKELEKHENAILTAIDDRGINKPGQEKLDYLPYVEIVFFAVLRALAYDKGDIDKNRKRLWELYTSIPNIKLKEMNENILLEKCFDRDGNPRKKVILELVPDAEPFDPQELEKLYERIGEFIRKA